MMVNANDKLLALNLSTADSASCETLSRTGPPLQKIIDELHFALNKCRKAHLVGEASQSAHFMSHSQWSFSKDSEPSHPTKANLVHTANSFSIEANFPNYESFSRSEPKSNHLFVPPATAPSPAATTAAPSPVADVPEVSYYFYDPRCSDSQ